MVKTYLEILISNYTVVVFFRFFSILYTEFIGETAGFIIKYKNWGIHADMLIAPLNFSLYM